LFDNDEIIHRYRRAKAIADGLLVDVTANEIGNQVNTVRHRD
jgi:hypothetical protein